MKRYLIISLLVIVNWSLVIFSPALAALDPWVDSWNSFTYHSTNGETKNFSAFILRSETKAGVKLLENSMVNPYLAYYGVYSQDSNYWNNNLAVGVGVRAHPFMNYQATNWSNEWIPDVKLFVEILSLTFLQDRISAEAVGVKTNDTRFGVDLWHEWNLKDVDYRVPWAETWFNLSYRDTNFYQEKFKTYLLFWRSRIGGHMGKGIRPYVVLDLMYSGRPESWFNNLFYGLGLRIEPFSEQEDPPEMLKKFKMFAEVLGIAWLREADSRPGNDLRFGVEFTIGR